MAATEKPKQLNITSCVISEEMLSTESLSRFSELVISMTGNSSGYLSVYVNCMIQDAKEKQQTHRLCEHIIKGT